MLKLFQKTAFTNIISFTLTFDKGKYINEKFTGYMEICPNPFCPCHDIKFAIRKKYDLNNVLTDLQYDFTIDIFKQKYIKKNNKADFLSENRKFAKLFVNDMTEKIWTELRDVFYLYKHYIINHFDPENSEINFNFPVDDIEKDGVMISYHEIFPFAEDILFKNEGIQYLVDEQYCLDPKCSCKEVALTIIPFKNNKFPVSAQMTIRFNYQKKTWVIINNSHDKLLDLNKIVHGLIEIIPDLCNTLKQRHEKCKSLYNNFKRQNVISDVVPKKIKIGRNDPCPCGSGKKYKKCCGR